METHNDFFFVVFFPLCDPSCRLTFCWSGCLSYVFLLQRDTRQKTRPRFGFCRVSVRNASGLVVIFPISLLLSFKQVIESEKKKSLRKHQALVMVMCVWFSEVANLGPPPARTLFHPACKMALSLDRTHNEYKNYLFCLCVAPIKLHLNFF